MKIHIIMELEKNLKISETTKWRHSMEKPMIPQKSIHPGSFNCRGEGDRGHSSNWWSSFSHRIKTQLLLILSIVYTVWVCSFSDICDFKYLKVSPVSQRSATSNIWRCLPSHRGVSSSKLFPGLFPATSPPWHIFKRWESMIFKIHIWSWHG